VTDTEDTERPSISLSDDKQVQTNATKFDDKPKIAAPLTVLVNIETTQKSNRTVLVKKINHKDSTTAD
jgi:predicted RNA-binding protein with PUA-like domain